MVIRRLKFKFVSGSFADRFLMRPYKKKGLRNLNLDILSYGFWRTFSRICVDIVHLVPMYAVAETTGYIRQAAISQVLLINFPDS